MAELIFVTNITKYIRGEKMTNMRSLASLATRKNDKYEVTSLTSQASGEKICHVEKFHLSLRDHCGEI